MSTLAKHFSNPLRQRQAAELGMWIFLATETMLFAPLFLGYAQARVRFPEAFAAASQHTDVVIGTINTAVLLTSSLGMALAVRAAKLHHRRDAILALLITAALGVVFLVLKGLEYRHEYTEHLVPWLHFEFEPSHRDGAALFYFMYFGMTGLHAIHLTIAVVMACVFAWRLHLATATATQVEAGGLYWHFVDSLWVFLYPILYLVGRHG